MTEPLTPKEEQLATLDAERARLAVLSEALRAQAEWCEEQGKRNGAGRFDFDGAAFAARAALRGDD